MTIVEIKIPVIAYETFWRKTATKTKTKKSERTPLRTSKSLIKFTRS